eukprot:206746-Prymnesium_polylepis.1
MGCERAAWRCALRAALWRFRAFARGAASSAQVEQLGPEESPHRPLRTAAACEGVCGCASAHAMCCAQRAAR